MAFELFITPKFTSKEKTFWVWLNQISQLKVKYHMYLLCTYYVSSLIICGAGGCVWSGSARARGTTGNWTACCARGTVRSERTGMRAFWKCNFIFIQSYIERIVLKCVFSHTHALIFNLNEYSRLKYEMHV